MYSIYHFFYSLCEKRESFKSVKKLDKFPFDRNLLSCQNVGVFPDLAVRLNKDRKIFSGGELVELKDSESYSVSSFNSTIPSRSKNIKEIIGSANSIVRGQMEKAGNEILSLPKRDVFYLIRGRKVGKIKVCLVSGAFFETITVDNLISQSFAQVFQERMTESKKNIPEELQKVLTDLFSKQANFSKVRNIDKASVKLRFRIMTEVKAEGNILNSVKYPQIKEDSLNFILSCDSKQQEKDICSKFKLVFGQEKLKGFSFFKIKHPLNGYFFVVQTNL